MNRMKPCSSPVPKRNSVVCYLVYGFLCAIFATLELRANSHYPRPDSGTSRLTEQSSPEGRQLFEASCAGCHGLDGRGGERGPDIAKRQQAVQLSDTDLLNVLRVGRPAAGMPPFDSLGETKLKAVLAYLRSLQGKGRITQLPGDPRRGKSLFFGKAQCSGCHLIEGAGGFLGRDLSVYGAALSPAEIRANLLRPGEGLGKANWMAVITMRNSSKVSGVIRNEDNFSIQLQSPDGTFHFVTRSEIAEMTFLPEPIMPTDYGSVLKPAELDDLVNYLIEVAKRGKTTQKEDWDDDD